MTSSFIRSMSVVPPARNWVSAVLAAIALFAVSALK
jgi:hypothetical protein